MAPHSLPSNVEVAVRRITTMHWPIAFVSCHRSQDMAHITAVVDLGADGRHSGDCPMYQPLVLTIGFDDAMDGAKILAKLTIAGQDGTVYDELELGTVNAGDEFKYGPLFAKFDLSSKLTLAGGSTAATPAKPATTAVPGVQRKPGK